MKLLKRLSWKWALAATILAIPLVLGWLYLFVDGPPVDDSDLTFEPRPIRHEDNGWPILAGKLDGVFWPDWSEDEEEEEGKSARERAERMLEEGIFDPELAREILAKNAEVLDAYEQTWKLPELRWWVGAGVTLDDSFRITKIRNLAQSASLRSLSAEQRGDLQRAFEEAMQVVRLGRKVRASSRNALESLVATALETVGMGTFQRILRKNRGAAPGLVEMGKEIIAGAASTEDSRRMARGEYAFAMGVFRQWSSGALDDDSSPVPALFRRRIFFLPRQTQFLLAEAARSSIRDASRPWRDREPFPAPPCVHEMLGGWLRFLPVRNGVGKHSVSFFVDALDGSHKRMVESRLRCLLLGVWIAIEAHRAEHGRLPASLAELVPSRLEEVPLDPYDGEPIRYSAAKAIIYSVGSDFIDSGGSTAEDWNKALADGAEPTLRIDG